MTLKQRRISDKAQAENLPPIWPAVLNIGETPYSSKNPPTAPVGTSAK